MKNTQKKALSMLFALCLVFTSVCLATLIASADETDVTWEETYYGTPMDYYAGGSQSISLTDSSFSDWNGNDLIEVNSAKNPENWQNSLHSGDLAFHYSLAWDATNLYLYLEIEKDMSADVPTARIFFDLTTDTTARTGLVDFSYDESSDSMEVIRADKFGSSNNVQFAASVKVFSEYKNDITYMEASIPWSEMGESFTPADNKSILYSLGVSTLTSGTSLYSDDATKWEGNTYAPWTNNTRYLTMHFNEGTATLPVVTPTPLATIALSEDANLGKNVAFGAEYTGTAGTRDGWSDSNGTLLTDGKFQDITKIGGSYMEGYQGTGSDGDLTPDIEDNGKIVKVLDLGEVYDSLYEFKVGSGQVIDYNILFPSEVEFYASENGKHFQYLGKGTVEDHKSGKHGGLDKEVQKYVLNLNEGIKARYVKVIVTPPEDNYTITTLSEISVLFSGYIIPIGNINTYFLTQDFKDLGYEDGNLAIIYTTPGDTLNSLCGGDYLQWWHVGIFEWDSESEAYILTNLLYAGEATQADKGVLVVPDDGFIVATNNGMSKFNNAHQLLGSQEDGTKAYLYGEYAGQDLTEIEPNTNLVGKLYISLVLDPSNINDQVDDDPSDESSDESSSKDPSDSEDTSSKDKVPTGDTDVVFMIILAIITLSCSVVIAAKMRK